VIARYLDILLGNPPLYYYNKYEREG
jgi:hypothetical protein